MSELKHLDHSVREVVATRAFRSGKDAPSLVNYERDFPSEHDVDLESVSAFIEEAMNLHNDQRPASDAWLASRLHYSLRLSRREAAGEGMWRWLSASFAPDYVRWRWGDDDHEDAEKDQLAPTERFVGPTYKNALARLWWMAELFRDGSNYAPVAAAFTLQDIPNNLFRMDVVHHRPTALAAVQVLVTGNGEGSRPRSGREANALAKAVNAAATTLVIDAIAPDSGFDPDAATRWRGESVDHSLYLQSLPPGPDDPPVPVESIARMALLLERLLDEAPVRGRDSGAM